ncbi:putative pentatricopeptide repeat-containing protein At4g17915 [Ziziphus jujuba]|uniref:Pentatricopeptide repeat-containing protein At4g17915 n=1 Tax=Ziziphus jujuba TaxID=326968 RepID=A0ABM3ISW1_ZIZJJ|nr:putative pentatricopeptide repeat-containing protein At4g17915 [Ziziphus jujuba]
MVSTRFLNKCVACFCKAKKLEKVEAFIDDGIRLGILPDVVTYNTLIDGYCQFVGLDAACSVLREMKEFGISPNAITYNSLIAWAFKMMHLNFQMRCPDMASEIFKLRIDGHGLSPTPQTFNMMINGFCKMQIAGEFGHESNATTYKTMMKLCIRSNEYNQALEIISEMRSKGFSLDGIAHCTIIGGSVKTGRTEEANHFKEQMMSDDIEIDLVSYNILLHLYFKKGNFIAANEVLKEIQRAGLRFDQCALAIMVNEMCNVGQIVMALRCLYLMIMSGFPSNLVASK